MSQSFIKQFSLFLKAGRKLASLQKDYMEAQEKAKKAHLNIWRYGDISADDAKEFGAGK